MESLFLYMAQADNLTLRVNNGLRERVEDFQAREGYEHLSTAGKELIEVGLRERQNPMVWRAKERVVDWANMLVVGAVVVGALGATTGMYAAVEGLLAAVVLLAIAAMLLAGLELARGVAGANPMGARLREVLRGVSDRE